MSQVKSVASWLQAILTTNGTVVKPDKDGWVTLAAGTYVFVVRTTDQPLESFNVVTDATIAWSGLTVEDTNSPRNDGVTLSAAAAAQDGTCTDWDVSADSTWTQENPTTAYVGTSGVGWTVTNLTLVKTAGKGTAMIHLGNSGAARTRLKVVVTTGGTMRVAPFGKS